MGMGTSKMMVSCWFPFKPSPKRVVSNKRAIPIHSTPPPPPRGRYNSLFGPPQILGKGNPKIKPIENKQQIQTVTTYKPPTFCTFAKKSCLKEMGFKPIQPNLCSFAKPGLKGTPTASRPPPPPRARLRARLRAWRK